MKYLIIVIFFTFFTFLIPKFCVGQFNMQSHIKQNVSKSDSDFLNLFPYKKYLDIINFTDFQTLQSHRLNLYQSRNIGDDFLYHLGDSFLKQYPIINKTDQLNAKILIGESFLASKKKINQRTNEIYQIIGYFILGKVAQKIEIEIRAGNFDLSENDNEKIIDRLANSKVYLTIEKGTLEKLIDATKKGNFGYIFDRFSKKFQELIGSNKIQTKLKLTTFNHVKNSNVDIFQVKEGNSQIGYCIWLERPHIKAKYFAAGNVYQQYNNFVKNKGSKNVVLATAGGFTNLNRQPEGLTVDKGQIVNAVLLPERHGLVIVQDNGGVRVANVKNEFRLPGITNSISPLNSLIDYSLLINWCKNNRATLFQTQLLAYGDKLLIQLSKAANQLRERRILAIVRDNKTGIIHNIIFHIQASKNLAVIAVEIFDAMKARKKKVEAILNLDVGSYDILRVNDKNGNQINSLKGPISITNATNLIIYYK